jgi:hypothetical protein
MNFVEQLTAVALLVDFFLGVTIGVVGGAVHGSLREDRKRTLLGQAPDPVSRGARAMLVPYARDDGYMARLLAGGDRVPASDRDEWRNDDSGAKGRDLEW